MSFKAPAVRCIQTGLKREKSDRLSSYKTLTSWGSHPAKETTSPATFRFDKNPPPAIHGRGQIESVPLLNPTATEGLSTTPVTFRLDQN